MAVITPIIEQAIRSLRLASASISKPFTGDQAPSAATVDLRILLEDFKTISNSEAAKSMMAELIKEKAYEIQHLMFIYAPVKSGELRNSIEVRFSNSGQYVEIEPMAEHAQYLEYGTGSKSEFGGTEYEIKPKDAKALRFEIGGKTVYAKKVMHPGIEPQPFVRVAVLDGLSDMEELVLQGAVDLIINTPGSHGTNMPPSPQQYAPTPQNIRASMLKDVTSENVDEL